MDTAGLKFPKNRDAYLRSHIWNADTAWSSVTHGNSLIFPLIVENSVLHLLNCLVLFFCYF